MANKARVLIKDKGNDNGDLVVWKWIKGEETVLPDFGDPENTQDYTLCVFDNGATKLEAAIPAGGTCGTAPCWKPIGTNGFKYIDNTQRGTFDKAFDALGDKNKKPAPAAPAAPAEEKK